MYRKIMVPMDESRAALRALNEAIRLAQLSGAMLRVVTVVDLALLNWGSTGYLQSAEVLQAIAASGAKVLAQAEIGVRDSGVPFETEVLESTGDKIADVLVADAREHGADLLVMGTHGFSGLMHLLMGSVAEGVLRQADIPVMLLRVAQDD